MAFIDDILDVAGPFLEFIVEKWYYVLAIPLIIVLYIFARRFGVI